MSNIYVKALLAAQETTLNALIPQDISAWNAIQYTYSFDLGNLGNGSLFMPGTDANGNLYWTKNYAFTATSPLNSMITFATDRTILNFPVSGVYNIHWRIRTGQSTASAQGQSIGPYLIPLIYLGVTNTDMSAKARLSSTEMYGGASGSATSGGDTTISYTGYFQSGDQVAMGVYTTNAYQTSIVYGNIGTRITSTLLLPAV